MTKAWTAPLGGNPLRPFKDGRPRRCRWFGCVMSDDYTCCRCDAPLLRYEGCAAIANDKPTLRCHLFGCKLGGDELVHQLDTTCSCGRKAFVVGPDGYGIVHSDCCVRCGRYVFPTARVARR